MNTDHLEHRLDLMKRDSKLPEDRIDQFGAWIRTADDESLYRIPVLQWAERHAVLEDEAIDLFLHAARAGIFEMLWGVMCPACGMLIHTPGGLRAMGPDPHCQLCRVAFPAAMDDQVEVIFSLEPSVRPLRYHDPTAVDAARDAMKLFYTPSMIMDPFHAEMIEGAVQATVLAPGERRVLRQRTVAGHAYAVVSASVHGVSFLDCVDGAPTRFAVECLDGATIPPRGRIGPGELELEVRNAYESHLTLILMDMGPHPDMSETPPPGFHYEVRPFLTGKRVLTSQTFRDLFRGERIGDQGLRIKNLAVVFTDLQASTQLYERVGDLRALQLVREHFDRITEVVARHRGAVVKTIGDAVMAAFGEPDRAVAAAAGIVRAVARIDADGQPMQAKVGVHAGSCIAIQTNHQIDYFGTAVNVAARVQGVAKGGEIVLTDTVWRSPGVSGLVGDFGLGATPDRVDLRGIAAVMDVQRLR